MRWNITRAFVDDEHPERSEVELRIDLTSVDTGSSVRDRHLMSRDFLDVTRYPTATAKLHNVVLTDPQHFSLTVDLDLHGISHTFPMQFTIIDRAARAVAGEVVLKRTDFDIGGTGSFLNPLRVDDEVKVMVEVTVPPATTAR